MCDKCTSKTAYLSGLTYTAYEPKSGPYADDDAYAGKRPRPIITSIKVDSQGSIGLTRKCAITITAFTKTQLDELVACYCVADMSVRVEYGWNVDARSLSSPGPITADRYTTDVKAICQIKEQRKNNPAYNGLQGRVGKWSISFNKEAQTWDIAIDIIATSAPVLTKSVVDNGRTCECTRSNQQSTQGGEASNEESTLTTSYLHSTFINLADFAKSKLPSKIKDLLSDIVDKDKKQVAKAYIISLEVSERSNVGEESSGLWAWFKGVFGVQHEECYVTMNTLLKIIESRSFTQEVDANNSIYGTFDLSKVSKLNKYAISSNPLVCIIPGSDKHSTSVINKALPSPPETAYTEDGINASNILVNVIHVSSILQSMSKDASLQDFLDTLFQDISRAVGNIWELSVVDIGDMACDDKKNVPSLAIVDLTQTKADARQPYQVSVGATSTLVRDISLSLKLSQAMQTQALYAGTRTDKSGVPCDDERYKKQAIEYKNLATIKSKSAEAQQSDMKCGDCKQDKKADKKTPVQKLDDALEELYDDINITNIESAGTKLLNYYSYQKGKTENSTIASDACKDIIHPYELEITFDGIGGFAFGQWITTDALPQAQYDTYDYFITSVEDSVTYGDWTTKIKAYARYKQNG